MTPESPQFKDRVQLLRSFYQLIPNTWVKPDCVSGVGNSGTISLKNMCVWMPKKETKTIKS